MGDLVKIEEIADEYPCLEAPIKRIKQIEDIGELYPPQSEAVKRGALEKSAVLSFPTASGKTIIAELAMLRGILKGNGKAIYIVPLKALANEKYENFKEKYAPLGIKVGISTGDFDSTDAWLDQYDIIIATSEKTDSLIRHEAEWLPDLSVVVADETHLINDPQRGPTLEVTLTRLKDMQPNLNFLLLSATLSNAEDLAEWIGGELIESDFRPVKLYEGIYREGKIRFNQKEDYKLTNGKKKPVLAIATDTLKKEKQALVFVSTRRSAEAVARRLSKVTWRFLERKERRQLKKVAKKIYHVLTHPTEQCEKVAQYVQRGAAFHHAGLKGRQKLLIEKNFRRGLIKFVAATPSLAMGMDLPAFRVILRDTKRYTGKGMEWIPTLEYEQMCLPFDEKIILSDGSFKEIGKIVEENFDGKVLTKSDKGVEPKGILDYHKRKSKVFKVKTEIGSFEATPTHPIKTVEGWKKVENLKKGDMLEWKHNNNSEDRFFFELLDDVDFYVVGCDDVLKEYKSSFNLTDKQLCERLGLINSIVYHDKNDKEAYFGPSLLKAMRELGYSKEQIGDKVKKIKSADGNTIKIPKKISPDFMWLVGLMSTERDLNIIEDKQEGSTFTRIRIFNTDERIIKKAIGIFKRIGLSVYKEKRENCARVEVENNLLATILKRKFGISCPSKSKITDIPEFFYTLPKNLLGGYLSGMFDGDGSYTQYEYKNRGNRRVHISTGSNEFARGLQELFHKIKCKATVKSRETQSTSIQGRENRFKGNIYEVMFRDVGSIKNFKKNYKGVNELLDLEYSDYYTFNQYYKKQQEKVKVREVKEKGKEVVYNITVAENHNYFLSNGLLLHNCGRSGRPKYDSYGEAILVAKSESKVKELQDRYIQGEAEEIDSKLAVEPVLRMYVLTIICEGYNTQQKLNDFFSKTFYGSIYGSTKALRSKLEYVLTQLKDYGFIGMQGEKYRSTKVGERVSELYVDPFTVHTLIEFLKQAERREVEEIAYLFVICDTTEMEPLPSLRKNEKSRINKKLTLRKEDLPRTQIKRYDYYRVQKAFKLSLVLEDWINERGEDRIFNSYNITPGTLFAKISITDWLLYACAELCKLFNLSKTCQEVQQLRKRVKHGIKKELLSLVEVKGVGRVRARKLYSNGIKNIKDLKKARTRKLSTLLGPKLGKKLKKRAKKLNPIEDLN